MVPPVVKYRLLRPPLRCPDLVLLFRAVPHPFNSSFRGNSTPQSQPIACSCSVTHEPFLFRVLARAFSMLFCLWPNIVLNSFSTLGPVSIGFMDTEEDGTPITQRPASPGYNSYAFISPFTSWLGMINHVSSSNSIPMIDCPFRISQISDLMRFKAMPEYRMATAASHESGSWPKEKIGRPHSRAVNTL